MSCSQVNLSKYIKIIIHYNLLKYNRKDQVFKYCFVFYDDLTKQERHRVKIKLFMEDQNEVSR